jgi:hypothetical protein
MRRYKKIITLFAFILVAVLLSSAPLYAERRVVNEADITEEKGCAILRVSFDFPVRYIRHFPSVTGTELRIQFEPISVGRSDSEDLFDREEVWFSSNGVVPLLEVIFEGNISGGPFLTFTFERSISYEVEPGADFRSLVVIPYQDKERAECFPVK